MPSTRMIKKILRSKPTIEGAGVALRRAFGFHEVREFDPFLLLDDFRSDNPAEYLAGFPWHPHRGIETITYVLGGKIEHGDSMGNQGVIGSGDVQWMTAGSGIIHQEMPKGRADGIMGGFQLWANLPASHKMMAPRYRGIEAAEIPTVTMEGGASAKIVAGTIAGVQGPVTDVVTNPLYMDISMPAQSKLTFAAKPDHNVLAYVIDGKGYFDPRRDAFGYDAEGMNYFELERDCLIDSRHLVVFGEGEQLEIATTDNPVRFLLFAGKPLNEPIAWYGPIVMNTQEELRIAFAEYQNGTFIKT
jgi:quercetin 2,3-dioxygenase